MLMQAYNSSYNGGNFFVSKINIAFWKLLRKIPVRKQQLRKGTKWGEIK